MSTDYVAFERDGIEISVWEGSSQFRIIMSEHGPGYDDGVAIIETKGERLTAEELVDVAIKILHPALYNVEDPKAFHEKVVERIKQLQF